MRSLIRMFVILREAVRAALMVIPQLIRWCFSSKGPAIFSIVVIIIFAGWAVGFFYYIDSIDKSLAEVQAHDPEINKKTDAIVVLTGGSERLSHGFYLLKQGMADRLFISGVNKDVKLVELLAISGYSKDEQQALGGRIELGYSAADTIQNAQEIGAWVKKNNIRSIRLVTSNYHIRRAYAEIHNEIPNVEIINHVVIPLNIRIDRWWEFSSTRSLLISQYNKYLLSMVRIFVERLGF